MSSLNANDHRVFAPLLVATLILATGSPLLAQQQSPSFLDQLKANAKQLEHSFGESSDLEDPSQGYSSLAMSFLSSAKSIQSIPSRIVYRRKNPRSTITPEAFEKLSQSEQVAYSRFECDERVYFGHYSTPLAWARPFDRLGKSGFKSFDGKRVLDFGFGNVGQLRMMASLGAAVTGIEVDDSIPSAMYRLGSDRGEVEKCSDSIKATGSLKLAFGKWPAEQDIVRSVGEGYDLFISKNVLKYGYIHPEKEAPSSQTIDLGVDDKTFLSEIFRILNPGGMVLVYNIHPPKSNDGERYKPWAYGETPWDPELVKKTGFEIVKWHVDDSNAIHEFGRQIGWNDSFSTELEFERNFRAMYTILKKPK